MEDKQGRELISLGNSVEGCEPDKMVAGEENVVKCSVHLLMSWQMYLSSY